MGYSIMNFMRRMGELDATTHQQRTAMRREAEARREVEEAVRREAEARREAEEAMQREADI